MKNTRLKILFYCWGVPFFLLVIFFIQSIIAGKYHVPIAATGIMAAAFAIRIFLVRKKFLYDILVSDNIVTALYLDHFNRIHEIIYERDSIDIISVNERNVWPGLKDTMLISDSNKSINFVIIDKKLHERLLQKTGLAV